MSEDIKNESIGCTPYIPLFSFEFTEERMKWVVRRDPESGKPKKIRVPDYQRKARPRSTPAAVRRKISRSLIKAKKHQSPIAKKIAMKKRKKSQVIRKRVGLDHK